MKVEKNQAYGCVGGDSHDKHEKYRNYLRDICHIDIDRTKK